MSLRRFFAEIIVIGLAMWGLIEIISRFMPGGWPVT